MKSIKEITTEILNNSTSKLSNEISLDDLNYTREIISNQAKEVGEEQFARL